MGNLIDPKRAHTTLVMLGAASGAAVGAGPVLMMGSLPLLHQALYGCILFSMPSAGVAVSQSSRYIIAAYALAMLVPTTLTWIVLHPEHAQAQSTLTVIFCALIITVAADGDKLLRRSVEIRRERDRLIVDLEERNAEVRAAMQRAQDSAQARARVLAAASHDLRQPLHALSVYSAVLAANPKPAVLREVGSAMDQIVRSLGSLLHGLLDLSRLSAGQVVLDHTDFDFESVVGAVCTEARAAAEHKGLALLTALAPAPTRLRGDSVALGRIARNLVDNAIKYTDAGTVTVSTRVESALTGNGEAEDLAVLEVADTGRGIPEAERTRVFEEYYQVDNPGRDRSQGVGLGLAIVQRLAELMGARIELESAAGRGTRFLLKMPIERAHAKPAANDADAAEASLEGRRVYLVDDEVEIARSMGQLLALWGVTTSTADSAASAERLFETHGTPDLLIADLRLPAGEHGGALAKRLQQRWGDFPVLIVTGETATPALHEAVGDGYTVLLKPVAAESLREAMQHALSRASTPI
jgi:signal transduction histidine kinase